MHKFTHGSGPNVTTTTRIGDIVINSTGLERTITLASGTYSLNDATAVESLSQKDRESFWLYCSDEGKNSALYLSYAETLLAGININIATISTPSVKQLFINNAKKLSKVEAKCASLGIFNAVRTIYSPENTRLDLFVKHSHEVFQLLEYFIQAGYKSPIAILKEIDPVYLELTLKNAFATTQLCKGLETIGYKEAYNTLQLRMEVDKLEYLLKNYHNFLEIMKGLLLHNIQDPLEYFCLMSPQQSLLFIMNYYNCLEVIKRFAQLGYLNAVDKFLALSSNQAAFLLKNYENSFQLMKAFQKVGEPDPLTIFLNLNDSIVSLFLHHLYAATEIMSALHKQGKKPVSYLEKLGIQAISTMLKSQYEYVTRINRGVDLEQEFLSPSSRHSKETVPPLFFATHPSSRTEASTTTTYNSAIAIGPGSVASVINFGNFDNFEAQLNRYNVAASQVQHTSITTPMNVAFSTQSTVLIEIDEELNNYLNSFSKSNESYKAAFARLKIRANECFCPISLDVPNKPVRIAGMLFDYDSIIKLPEISTGIRENPLTGKNFRLDQIQPDRQTKDRIEQLINSVEQRLKEQMEDVCLKQIGTTFVVTPTDKISVVSAPTTRFFPGEQKAHVPEDNPDANEGHCCSLM